MFAKHGDAPKPPNLRSVFEEVWADPDDRDLRQVVADSDKDPAFRIEREPGEPWRVVRVKRTYEDASAKWFEAFRAGVDDRARAALVAQWQASTDRRR